MKVPGTDQHFHMGATMYCLDGRAGILYGLLLNGRSFKVTHMLLKRTPWARGAIAVPLDRIVVPMGEHGVVGITLAELDAMEHAPEAAVRLGRDSAIECEGRLAGVLDCVLVDRQTHGVTHVVVRGGGLLGYDRVVPAEWIGEIRGDRIILATTWATLSTAERFATHREAAHHVQFELES